MQTRLVKFGSKGVVTDIGSPKFIFPIVTGSVSNTREALNHGNLNSKYSNSH